MTMDFLQDFSLKIIVKLESSLNLPMPTAWLPLEALRASTGFHSLWTIENIAYFIYIYICVCVCVCVFSFNLL